jgi:hypothetical protein
MHQDTFNSNLYVVAATIIPLFYLALTLQGHTVEILTSRLVKEIRREDKSLWHFLWSALIGAGALSGGLAILVAGVTGEWLAILAVYNESASTTNGSIVLLCLLVMLIAVVTGPLLRLLLSFLGVGPED